MTRGLLDTSVFIARESRGLSESDLPDEVAASIVSHAELSADVLAAIDLEVRARRSATLTAVADMNPLPIDLAVAEAWARVRVQLANARRRANVNDMWIGATALALGVPVVTRDRHFDVIADVSGLDVIRVERPRANQPGEWSPCALVASTTASIDIMYIIGVGLEWRQTGA